MFFCKSLYVFSNLLSHEKQQFSINNKKDVVEDDDDDAGRKIPA